MSTPPPGPEALSPVKQALLTIHKLQETIRELKQARTEPIAILGMGCRFPGGATNPERYWRLLRDGVDAIGEVPSDRWDARALHAENPEPGKILSRQGGFCEAVDRFDAEFFGISPREAHFMDPQQRLLLEVSWEALEHANQVPARLFGSPTGVFVGISTQDYATRQWVRAEPERVGAYSISGTVLSVAAGRLSYALGLSGPSLSVDTACSSSLTALHLACESLRRGECDLALSGGVGLLLAPEPSIAFSQARMLSPDGRCKTFDASANGYVRGEGCGVLVLKRLSTALADGDSILALIRGSAINQDGASGGLTIPSGPAQEAVIRKALAQAQVGAHEVGYVEAHGTGTSLGDPIELRSLSNALGAAPRTSPLWVGSVKTNLGHLEAAAGVAGVIKVVLALQHGELPPHLHLRTPTPHFPWESSALRVPTERTPWPEGAPRLAGVSAFAFSGSNAHVVLSEAPPRPPPAPAPTQRRPQVLALSARSPQALQDLARRHAEHLEAHPTLRLEDVCHTANTRRSPFAQRLAVVASSPEELVHRLRAFAEGSQAPGVHRGEVHGERPPHGLDGEGARAPEVLAQAFVTGSSVDWEALEHEHPPQRVSLPTYPFQRQRYWFTEVPSPRAEAPGTSFLGRALASPFLDTLREWTLGEEGPSLLQDHRVGGEIVIAGAHCLSLMLATASRGTGGPGCVLEEVTFPRALALPAGQSRTVQLGIAPAEEGRAAVRVASCPQGAPGPWTTHATATLLSQEGEHEEHSLSRETLEARCPRALSPTELYAHARGQGIELGSSFQWLSEIRVGTGEAVGRLDRPSDAEPLGEALHPGLIDGCFQLLLAVLPESRPEALVPFRLERLHLRAPPTSPTLFCHARLLESSAARVLCALRLFDGSGQVLLEVEGFEARPVSAEALAGRSGADALEGLYAMAWRPAALPGTLARELPPAPALVDELRPSMEGLWDRRPLTAHAEGLAALERLGAAFARRTLGEELGLDLSPGRLLRRESLARELGVVPKHQRLLGRLVEILAEEGWLRARGADWEVVERPPVVDPMALRHELERLHPEVSRELSLLERCGTELGRVLRGERDPLELLFPGGDDSVVTALYAQAPAARGMNSLLSAAVSRALAHLPEGRRARLLEIGAGTGATTTYVLERLGGRPVEYVFTDVSPLFTTRARERFTSHPALSFQTLDIEREPGGQGLEEHSFDVVLAANVLHATRDVETSLRHARRLLAPGGLLVLLEGVARQRWLDLIFGLTPGWWRFEDTALRPTHPLLSAEAWCAAAKRQGFSTAGALSPDDAGTGARIHQAVILATADTGQEVQGAGEHWLVLADRGGYGDALAQWLRARGASCDVARMGTGPARPSEHEHQVDPTRPEALAGLLEALGPTPPSHVVHLWSLDALTSEPSAREDADRGLAGALHLVRALVGRRSTPPSLWWVTRGEPATPPGTPGLFQSPLWGLGRVVALEHPELKCRLLDVGEETPAGAAQRLWEEAHSSGEENQISYRLGARHVARLARYRLQGPAGGVLAPRSEATYLITGGLGGLGLLVARKLVERGARHLVLVGRRDASPEARGRIEELERRGARVLVRQADVGDRARMRAVVEELEASSHPLRGVIHSAGMLEDGVLARQDWGRMKAAMEPKIEGAWNLHLLTQHLALDFFVLFSSAASLLGSAGQASHAAGNMFLDTLAAFRRATGLPALSLGWSAWSEVGAAARVEEQTQGSRERWAQQGFSPLSPAQGLAAFERLMAEPSATHVGVIPIDWARFSRSRPQDPTLRELRETPRVPVAATRSTPQDLRTRLSEATPGQREALLLEHVRSEAARVLGMKRGDAVDIQRGLLQQGLDSLTAMELRNRLQSSLGRPLPASLTFEHPTVEALARYLGQSLPEVPPGTVRPPAPPAETALTPEEARSTLGQIDQMAEEDVDSLLLSLMNTGRTPP